MGMWKKQDYRQAYIASGWRTSVSPHHMGGASKRAGKRLSREAHKPGRAIIAKGADALAMLELLNALQWM